MKKFLPLLILSCFIIIGTAFVLNINVSIKQGVNGQVSLIRMPLYLKLLDFTDRHYNYKQLVKTIIDPRDDEQRRIMKIFAWTYKNIKRQPESLPVIDDHVWHIIVRGYGESDQFQDVFTTLCNYGGIDAFFDFIYTKDQKGVMPLSFVRLNGEWRVFDAYNKVCFKNKRGEFATIGEIKNGDWLVVNLAETKKQSSDYGNFMENLPSIKNAGLKRANIQSPFRRMLYQIKKWLTG